MKWEYRGDHLYSGDFVIRENFWPGKHKITKNYSLYLKDKVIFEGTFKECKEEAKKHE